MVQIEPGNPREPGESFRFIAEETEIFTADSFDESSDRLSLVASAGKYGINFLGSPTCINVYRSSKLIDDRENSPLTIINGRGTITHLATSCDSQTLFVVSVLNGAPFGSFYDVFQLIHKPVDVAPFYSSPLSAEPASRVTSMRWNPCDPTCIAVSLSTGDLSLLRIKESSIEFTSKNGLTANSVAWSAKGKQLAVGKRDGTLSLFKPDLTLVRDIEAPSFEGFGPVIDITWFTNTEFFVGYLTTNNIPALVYVNAPKGKPATFANFEDVCYSNESGRPVSYYTYFLNEWNLLLVLSSNSVELGLVGLNESGTGDCKWCQWFPDDNARASMHFYNVLHETFPLGIGVDFTSQKKFPTKDEKQTGPLPAVFAISSRGEVNVFFIDNKLNGVQNLNCAAESVPGTGFRTPQQFGSSIAPVPTVAVTPVQVANQPPVATQASQGAIFSSPTVAQNLKVSSPLDTKGNAPSAFSSITKKSEEVPAGTQPSFSTPINPTFGGGLFDSPKVGSVSFLSSTSGPSFVPPSISSSLPSSQPFLPSSGAPLNLFGTPSTSTTFAPFSISTSSTSATAVSTLPPPTTPASPFHAPATSAPLPFKGPPSPFPQKPVSLSNQISTTGLRAPSPKKTKAFTDTTTTVVVPQSTSASSGSLALQSRVSKESILFRIEREKENFEREMKEHSAANDALNYKVGTEGESGEVNSDLEQVKEWMSGMKKTTEELSEEVAELHQKTLEALASYEDANSHRQMKFSSRNLIYVQLRPLDPYSQRKLNEVRSKYNYLVSQIGEVNAKLELQWENYSANKKSKRRDQRSSTENLYRSVLNLHNKRVAVERQMNDMLLRLKKLSLSSVRTHSTSFHVDGQSSYFSKFATSDSPISPPQPKVTPTKTRQLKEVLSQRKHTPVRNHAAMKSPRDGDDENEAYSPTASDSGLFVPSKSGVPKGPIYEDITPTKCPMQGPAKNANPLAALSFMVGKVTGTETAATSTPVRSDSLNSQPDKQNIALPKVAILSEAAPSSGIKYSVAPLQANLASPQPRSPSTLSFQVPSTASSPFTTGTGHFPTFGGGTGAITAFSSPVKPLTPTSVAVVSQRSDSSLAGLLAKNNSVPEATTSATSCIGSSFFKPSVTVKLDGTVSTTSSSEVGGQTPASPTSATAFKAPSSQLTAPNLSAFKLEEKSSNSPSNKTSSNVVAANPILSAQILKETPSMSGSGSTSGSLGLFGQMPASSPLTFSFGQQPATSSPAPVSPSVSNSIASSASSAFVFRHTPTSSIFGQPSPSPGCSMDGNKGILSFGQTPVSSASQSVVQAISSSTSNTVTASISSSGQLLKTSLSTASAFTQPTASVSVNKPDTFKNLTITALGPPASSAAATGQPASTVPVSITTASVTQAISGISLFKPTSSPTVSVLSSQASSSQTSTSSILSQAISSSTSIFGGSQSTPSSSSAGEVKVAPETGTSLAGSLFGQAAQGGNSPFKFPAVTLSAFSPSSSTTTSGLTATTSSATFQQGNNASSVFGQASASGSGVFAATSSSPFGPVSTSQSIFGGASLSAQSPFGKTAPTVTSSTQIGFSQATPIFGSGTLSQAGNQQGGPTFQSSSFGTQSIFGQAETSASNTATISVPTTSAAASPFNPVSSSGVFGSPSGSVFGNQSSLPFGNPSGSTPAFGSAPQNQQPAAPSGSIFGNAAAQSNPTGSIFGGAPQTTSSTVFGGGAATNSPFSTGFGLGSNTASPFSSSGPFFSGLGKAPSKEDDSKNVFGAVKSTAPQPSIFGGGSSGGVFGSSAAPQASAFNLSKPAEGSTFGGSASFGAAPTFGGSPAFGDKSKSVFGGGAIFGGSPTFGGATTAKGSVFGSSSTSAFSPSASSGGGGFGSFAASGGASTFGGLASGNQPTSSPAGFGQLSQQGPDPLAGSPMGKTSSFTAWR